jgi:hypothetical protein
MSMAKWKPPSFFAAKVKMRHGQRQLGRRPRTVSGPAMGDGKTYWILCFVITLLHGIFAICVLLYSI